MPEEKQQIISKASAISIGLALSLVGAVVWLTLIFAGVRANEAAIANLQNEVTSLKIEQGGVTDRMARIETKLDLLIDTLNIH